MVPEPPVPSVSILLPGLVASPSPMPSAELYSVPSAPVLFDALSLHDKTKHAKAAKKATLNFPIFFIVVKI
jgi:hypothetical protein